jgi:hypothetical protein
VNIQVNPLPAIASNTFNLIAIPDGQCGNTPYGSIAVTTVPDGAEVFVKTAVSTSYQHVGTTPPGGLLVQQIMPGLHSVRVELSGYGSQEKTVQVFDHKPTPADFTFTPVNAKVLVVPQPLNIGRPTSYFVAFVTLPSGYKAADVVDATVTCEGATALKLFRDSKLFPKTFAAVFRRGDLDPTVTAGTYTMHVGGEIKTATGKLKFAGTSDIPVINKKVTTKETWDDVLKMTLQALFKFFKP